MSGLTTESAYEDDYGQIDSAQRFARWFDLESERVATTIYDAVVSETPNQRYTIGWDAKILLFLDWLPFGIIDRLVSLTD